jgi:hypothetical protein
MGAPNVEQGQFALFIGGRDRTGRIDLDAVCRIEEMLGGTSLAERLSGRSWSFSTMVAVLTVGLANENPKITRKHITTWVQAALNDGTADLEDFMIASQKAVVTSLGLKIREGVKRAESNQLEDADAKELTEADASEEKKVVESTKKIRSA